MKGLWTCGLTLAAARVALGNRGAAFLTPLMNAALFAVPPIDALTYAVVSLQPTVVPSSAAGYRHARRRTRPLIALRTE